MSSPDYTASGMHLVVHSKGEHPPHPVLQNAALETPPILLFFLHLRLYFLKLLSPHFPGYPVFPQKPPSPILLCRCTFEAFGVCDKSSPYPSLFWELGKASLYFLELGGRTSGLHFLVSFVKSTKQINTEPQNKQRKKKAFVHRRLILAPNLAAFLCLYFLFEHYDKFIFAVKALSYSRLLAT